MTCRPKRRQDRKFHPIRPHTARADPQEKPRKGKRGSGGWTRACRAPGLPCQRAAQPAVHPAAPLPGPHDLTWPGAWHTQRLQAGTPVTSHPTDDKGLWHQQAWGALHTGPPPQAALPGCPALPALCEVCRPLPVPHTPTKHTLPVRGHVQAEHSCPHPCCPPLALAPSPAGPPSPTL